MLRLIRTEFAKQVFRPRTWVALGFVVIVPVIIAVALKLNPPDFGGDGEEGPRYFYLATQSGLFLPVAALRLMSAFFLVVVICMFAGDAVASEAGWGNLRYLLTRPVGRGRLLTAKLFVASTFAMIATLLVALSGLIAGVIAFGGGGITVPFFDGLSQSPSDILVHLALAVVLITWGLAGVISFGFMLSTMTDSAAGAIFGAVGLYIVSLILGEITSLGSIRYGLPVHYYDAWTDLFLRNEFTTDMWRSVLLQIPYVLVFCGIAWWWFHRKDIKS
jgi:ABC-2 type transport system permease protein